jgi:hypothetical protein
MLNVKRSDGDEREEHACSAQGLLDNLEREGKALMSMRRG